MEVFKSKEFLTVLYTIVTKQYEIAIKDMLEANKLLKYVDSEDRRDNMNTTRYNLFRSRMLDKEIMSSCVNINVFLQSVNAALNRFPPKRLIESELR